MVPKNTIKLEGSAAKGMMKLNDALEDYDDVQNVYSNYEIDEADLE
jgi:transcriptional/translational regulatory protein YebC/TACO1